ncbi:L domain-like protein [Xylariaceae sp. FL0594]|nr:L domain-like protein [Xylariaceae sp. FL0594]
MEKRASATAPSAATANASRRESGIPKPSSRLPLPRSSIPTPATSSSTARSQQKPSIPPSTTTETIRGPRLRTTQSREHLSSTAVSARSNRPAQPPVGSQSTVKGLSNRNRTPFNDGHRPLPTCQPDSSSGSFKKPLVPRRRPSTQFNYDAQPLSATLAEDVQSAYTYTAEGTVENEEPELPTLTQSDAAENLTFEALLDEARKPRPSLAERTIETLSNLPSSPALRKRGSHFFDTTGPKRPQSKGSGSKGSGGSRPGSSYQSDRSDGCASRPSSRLGSNAASSSRGQGSFRASTSSYKPPLSTVQGTPARRIPPYGLSTTPTPTKSIPRPASRATLNKVPSRASLSASLGPRSLSPEKGPALSVSKFGSKTLAARPAKARGSIHGLFKKPSMPAFNTEQAPSELSPGTVRKRSIASNNSSKTSGKGPSSSSPSTASTTLTADSAGDGISVGKSSAALREQIAKAKAAKRAANRQASNTLASEPQSSTVVPNEGTFDFDPSDDPFGQKSFEQSNRKVMQSRIEAARVSGRLNIAAMGLKEIPEQVLKMYDLESVGRADGSWAESVDLTRLVAADNELETIADAIFPDVDPSDFNADEVDERGGIFWGLESADLHNNTLISLPMGLRRLQLLTSLNLTSNKLTNDCLDIIGQCAALRDLKLGNNLLHGSFPDTFMLENLEILDLHGNNISALPSNMGRMRRLRILNVDENALESLPFQSFSSLPLSELSVRKNKLTGVLIEAEVESLPQLQILDCSNNQLTHLVPPDSERPLDLPSLHQLTVSMNRLTCLPDMSNWGGILTINADDNCLTEFPTGFTSCETLKHAGFSGNDIRVLPAEIARMDNLTMLRITGNPLRDRKFTSLTTEALKDALLARLEPLPINEGSSIEHFANGINSIGIGGSYASTKSVGPTTNGEDSDCDDFATPPTSAPHSPVRERAHPVPSQTWSVKPGGILDRSSTQSSSLHPVECSKIAAIHSIREVRLQHNTLTQFPNSLSFFSDTLTSLNLSHNQLTGESWLTERLDLTALRELNMQSNYCTSLAPLTTYLCAPTLEKLDISINRIVRLPTGLRDVFPNLTVLMMANNRLEELDPDAIQGLKIVDASNNEIAHLNPHIGLLGGLERLDVKGNRFRVPRWNVLDRGTEATLRWLRGRVPVAEMAEWRAKTGQIVDVDGDDFEAGEME